MWMRYLKDDLIEKTIPKILEELDPHSQYIPAAELEKVNEPLEGNFSGIGIQFNMLKRHARGYSDHCERSFSKSGHTGRRPDHKSRTGK